LGGRRFIKKKNGGRPPKGGHALSERAKNLLEEYDSTMAEGRRLVCGENERLRIWYIWAAFPGDLWPALAEMRRAHPKLKVKLLDQNPGEIIIALRPGKIDLALTLQGAHLLSRDFYARKLATVRSVVTLPVSHRFADAKQLSLSQLK